MTEKDRKIIEDSEAAGIPIFVFTAKDLLSAHALHMYFHDCQYKLCPKEFLQGIETRWHEFEKWQFENPAKTKLPD
jgi:hypothetical protein